MSRRDAAPACLPADSPAAPASMPDQSAARSLAPLTTTRVHDPITGGVRFVTRFNGVVVSDATFADGWESPDLAHMIAEYFAEQQRRRTFGPLRAL